jgi:hypothetical protein
VEAPEEDVWLISAARFRAKGVAPRSSTERLVWSTHERTAFAVPAFSDAEGKNVKIDAIADPNVSKDRRGLGYNKPTNRDG